MSDLTKNKAANALVWAAFFAFWLHSLHCCRAHAATERCVFDLRCQTNSDDSIIAESDVFHRRQRRPLFCARAFCPVFPFLAPSRSDSTFDETPSFGCDRRAEKSRCAGACPSLRLPTAKGIYVDFDAFSARAFAGSRSDDVRFLSAVAFLNRLNKAFSTPLYLRLRKILN